MDVRALTRGAQLASALAALLLAAPVAPAAAADPTTAGPPAAASQPAATATTSTGFGATTTVLSGTSTGSLGAPAPGAPAPGRRPATQRISAAEAQRIAVRVPEIARVRRANPGSTTTAKIKDDRWVVDVNRRTKPGEKVEGIGQVYVDPVSGVVLESWTGFQVAWTMARGYPGAFGRSVNSPWIWITLCVLFVAPFVDLRRPLRLLHLDLLAMVGFSVSLLFFNRANLGLSVPLTLPLLLYLLVRLLWIGLGRGRRPAEPLRLNVPWPWLGAATLFLIGFRVGLNVADGNVIDVGYSGVIGADKLAHGRDLWGAFPSDNQHGDTYGPLLYLAYVPFELIWPWGGSWDDLGAAHAAAAVFDLACIGLLFLLGRRIAGTPLGVVLAYAWVTFPFTIYATNSGTNDALPAALVLAALLAHTHPLRRGALVAAAGLTKFAALALVPLFAAHGLGPPGARARRVLRYAAGVVLTGALGAAIVLASTDPATFWERTISFQAERDAPFSVWGFYGGGWEVAQRAVQLAAVLLAALLPFARRRDDVVGLAALAGALLVAFQAATTYWFYLYLVWVAPLALIAFLGRGLVQPRSVTSPAAPAPAAALSTPPVAVPSSG